MRAQSHWIHSARPRRPGRLDSARSAGRVQWSRRCPMSTRKERELMTQEEADMEEVCRLAAEGKKVTDPALLKRIQELTERIKAASGHESSLGTEAILDGRGPI